MSVQGLNLVVPEKSDAERDRVAEVSEVVEFAAEARCFVLDGEIQDVALYEGDAPLDGALGLL